MVVSKSFRKETTEELWIFVGKKVERRIRKFGELSEFER